ncbi:MAG TPA: hypothetical protein VFG33_04260, partial [Kribbella sp.]|nr:hypothetical protein [Kribbella sp.]
PAPPPPDRPAPTGSTGDCPAPTTAPNTAVFDPWGDLPAAGSTGDATPTGGTASTGSITPADAAIVDPWGDLPAAGSAGDTTSIGDATPVDAAAFDPWGDLPATG